MSEPAGDPDWEVRHLEIVETFSNPWDAELARARLEGEGISAVVADLHLIGMDWMLSSAVGGVKLKVPIEEAARARELLGKENPLSQLRLVTAEDGAEPRCPRCRSEDLYRRTWSREGFFLGTVLLGFPFPFFRRRWVCRRCGGVWKRGDLPEPDTPNPSEAEIPSEIDDEPELGRGGVEPR